MDINHLRYLVDVAQTKSITLSAKRLFISQQGLSQIMVRLENDLKVPLLNRHRQGVTLTEAGEDVVAKAQEILQKYNELLTTVQFYSQVGPQNLTGKLFISVVPFISSNLLPEVLDLYHKQYPGVEVHVQEKQPDEIIQDINNCDIDIGLFILPEFQFNEQILCCSGTYEKILENEMFAVVASHSPLAKKKKLTKAALYQQPLAIYNFAAYLKIISQMFKDLNRLNILVKTNSVELYKNAILNRQAVGITSSTDTRLLSDDSLVTLPLEESVKMFYGCFIPSSCSISAAAEAFISILKSQVSNLLNRKK
ncbi:LysR family transcriptional regulator [Desulfotomaculum defluvii]